MVSLQESMASSTNNSPYETLLNQVTALQSDLSKTLLYVKRYERKMKL